MIDHFLALLARLTGGGSRSPGNLSPDRKDVTISVSPAVSPRAPRPAPATWEVPDLRAVLSEAGEDATFVPLRRVMASVAFEETRQSSSLPIALGEDFSSQSAVADLTSMPHLLISGTTGSGKSVFLHSIIACLLCTTTPDDLQMIMIDPKRIELTRYNGIPHLLAPVVVDLERVVGTLQWVTREMEQRYKIFSQAGAQDIEDHNQRLVTRSQERMPYVVVLIDGLADLMTIAPDEVEWSIGRIAQKARVVGIHLLIATQRPTSDVLPRSIKSSFPTRACFRVASAADSRAAIDTAGAEWLSRPGDMLFRSLSDPQPRSLRGCFVSNAELQQLVNCWKDAGDQECEPSAQNGSFAQNPLPPLRQMQEPKADPLQGQTDELQVLREARTAIREGDREAGQRLLAQVLQGNPRSEIAWLWLSAIVDDPAKEREMLERVLEINPDNKVAQRHIAKFDRQVVDPRGTQTAPPAEPAVAPVRRSALAAYVGQEKTKTALLERIEAARERGDPLEHLLFCGPAEMGKATLAEAVADEMQVGFRSVNANELDRGGDAAAVLTNLHKGDILCIEHVDLLNKLVQAVLVPALEEYRLDITIGNGPGARRVDLPLPRFTMIGTTSSPSKVNDRLRRWFVTYDFEPYETSQIAKIITLFTEQQGLKTGADAAKLVAKHSKGLPGYAAFLIKRIAQFSRTDSGKPITLSAVREALAHFGYTQEAGTSTDWVEKLQHMDGVEFERFIANLLRKMGYVVELTEQTGDHGIDLFAQRGKERLVVQCKRWDAPVGEPVVRDFYGSLVHSGAELGYIMATTSFTSQALSFARDKPIELVDLDRLVQMTIQQSGSAAVGPLLPGA